MLGSKKCLVIVVMTTAGLALFVYQRKRTKLEYAFKAANRFTELLSAAEMPGEPFASITEGQIQRSHASESDPSLEPVRANAAAQH